MSIKMAEKYEEYQSIYPQRRDFFDELFLQAPSGYSDVFQNESALQEFQDSSSHTGPVFVSSKSYESMGSFSYQHCIVEAGALGGFRGPFQGYREAAASCHWGDSENKGTVGYDYD